MSIRVLPRSAARVGMYLAGLTLCACDRTASVTAPAPTRLRPMAQADALASRSPEPSGAIKHVLLMSIDGLHQVDLDRFIASHPHSTLAQLGEHGLEFRQAAASKPSDSFPGTLALVTGGTPFSTGVFYDVSYDRRLSPPGSNCATMGTTVTYDETIDRDPNRVDGGGGIDPATLPLDPSKGCTPVYPHDFLRVNTIFEVARSVGFRTAWSDKHLAYDIVNGPSGRGVDDLYSPEIAAPLPTGGYPEDNVTNAMAYDDLKVQVILNEIEGKDHSGSKTVGVPVLFGMTFQEVSVGEKTSGYTDASGTPTAALEQALEHTDASLGRMVDALDRHGLRGSTLIVVSAKHGQSPIDPALRHIVADSIIPTQIAAVAPGLIAQATEDDIALLWLTDQNKTAQAVAALQSGEAQSFLHEILWTGNAITPMFRDPRTDSRTPDIIGLPVHGVIYASPTSSKQSEHGGFTDDDNHVGLLVASPRIRQTVVDVPVTTRQIAPTILQVLGLDWHALQAVGIEGTAPLPGVQDELAHGR